MFPIILYLFITICMCLLLWLKQKHSYWKKRGVNGPSPLSFVGNVGPIIAGNLSMHEFATTLYKAFPEEKVVGYYQGLTPALLLRDPELINEVLVKANENFNSRGMRHREDKFDNNLFLAEGETWKIIRQKFNRLFTPAKMKMMYPLIDSCLENFQQHVDRLVTSGRRELNLIHICRLLTVDINGTCCFGVSMDVYSEKQNAFVDLSQNIFEYLITPGLRRYLEVTYPGFLKFISNLFRIEGPMRRLRQFFDKLIKDIVKQREGKPVKNEDLMDLFVKLKEERIVKNSKATVLLDDRFVATHAMAFFMAGFEPAAVFMSNTMYEMALRQDLQQRMFEDISLAASRHGGKVTCESIKDMAYLKMVFEEVLRKYTGALTRMCLETYTFPEHNLTIEKGTTILIPLGGLHTDPKYFKDPEVFDPERFSPENRSIILPTVYNPFGVGPRHCLGTQFGRMQCLMGVAGFFLRYRVYATAKTPRRLTLDPLVLSVRIKEDLWVGVAKR